jgi:subtilisin family serine protease
MKLRNSIALVGMLSAVLVSTSACSASPTLPLPATERAISALPLETVAKDPPRVQDYKVDLKDLTGPTGHVVLDNDGKVSTPFLIPNTMIIQFKPDVPEDDINKYLAKRNLKVIESFPKLGAVKVTADLSEFFKPKITDNSGNDALLRGVEAAIADFKKDGIVRSATPDMVLQRQDLPSFENIVKPSEISSVVAVQGRPNIDWGMTNIEADRVWDMPGAHDGVLFGVMDVGFARHQDLIFIDLPDGVAAADHGNHVAGIACARGIGMRGVLPNCFVRARTGDVYFQSAQGGNVTQFFAVFSQILGTLQKFILDYDDLRAINVSMGYNWSSNFSINPDAPESSSWRALVENQGLLLVTVLELADKANKVIYSAAGNDSAAGAAPINARYASPFNWAAMKAREIKSVRNGVIVEAHDSANKRAVFSNVGGNISCPGVDIISTVAHDANGAASDVQYGKMSGTSMASPYCASAHMLFSLVRPGYRGSEIVDCLMTSTEHTDSGAPILRLTQALKACPPKAIVSTR